MDKSLDFLTQLGTGIFTSTSSTVCDQEYLSVTPPLKLSAGLTLLDGGGLGFLLLNEQKYLHLIHTER